MTCQSPRCGPAAWTWIRTSLPAGTGRSMSASSRTSAEPYRSWTMARIVLSRPVTGLCPRPAITALTGADLVALGASMVVLSPRSGGGPALRDEPADPAGLRCWVGAVGGQGDQADGPGPEDHVLWPGVHAESAPKCRPGPV